MRDPCFVLSSRIFILYEFQSSQFSLVCFNCLGVKLLQSVERKIVSLQPRQTQGSSSAALTVAALQMCMDTVVK